MNFEIGDILHFDQYFFTDKGTSTRHFGLVLLPEKITKYENNILCCVITSQTPKCTKYVHEISCSSYDCLTKDSYVCFNRRDIQSKSDLSSGNQPKSSLNNTDLNLSYRKLKKSLYAVKDMASKWYKAAIIREWTKFLALKGVT